MTQRDLTSLIGSRICHDLISPIGAIGNGIELLEMTGVKAGPEMQLISESVQSANRRIKQFRIAFGAANHEQRISENEIKTSLPLNASTQSFSISWHPTGDQLRQDVKLIFLLIQCIEASTPYGANVDINHDGDGWIVTAQSEKLKADPHLWGLVHSPEHPVELTSGSVQFALIGPELERQNRKILIDLSDQTITARL